jgi:hypothetical protein
MRITSWSVGSVQVRRARRAYCAPVRPYDQPAVKVQIAARVTGVRRQGDESQPGLFDVGVPADAFDGAAADFGVGLPVDAVDGGAGDDPRRYAGAVPGVDVPSVGEAHGGAVVAVQSLFLVYAVGFGAHDRGPFGQHAHVLRRPPPAARPRERRPQVELVVVGVGVAGHSEAPPHVVVGDPVGVVLAVPGEAR